nr:MAG TPA: hypothetical protein [Caudoviricetes sp.]
MVYRRKTIVRLVLGAIMQHQLLMRCLPLALVQAMIIE